MAGLIRRAMLGREMEQLVRKWERAIGSYKSSRRLPDDILGWDVPHARVVLRWNVVDPLQAAASFGAQELRRVQRETNWPWASTPYFGFGGGSLICTAIRLRDLQLAEELIASGLSPNGQTMFGDRPLITAAAASDIEAIEFLFEHGAVVDAHLLGRLQKIRRIHQAVIRTILNRRPDDASLTGLEPDVR